MAPDIRARPVRAQFALSSHRGRRHIPAEQHSQPRDFHHSARAARAIFRHPARAARDLSPSGTVARAIFRHPARAARAQCVD
jgi:hypothetical protein